MSDLTPATVPLFRECRQAARAVRTAERAKEAIGTVRPRAVGLFRSRVPLALVIHLAGLEGRLVWRCPDAFAVLDAPAGDGPARRTGRRNGAMLRFVDHNWELLIFLIPPFLAMASALGLAFLPATRIAALLVVLFAVVWVTIGMLVMVVKGFVWLYGMLIAGRARDLRVQVVGQLCGLHWSIPLLHAGRSSEVAAILSAIAGQVTGLVHPPGPQAAGRSSDEGRRDVVLCLEGGVTTNRARDAVRATPGVTALPSHPVLVVALGRDRLLRVPPESPTVPVSGVPLLLLAMAAVIGVGADLVADAERANCAPRSCDGRPASYGDALYWLLNRLLGGDPDGLGAVTVQARSFGWLISVMGLVVIGWVIASILKSTVARVFASGPDLVRKYNLRVTEDSQPADQPSGSASSAVTSTVLAGGFVVVAFLGYVLGRLRPRQSRR